ncbi:hypothetical protein NECAME_12126 [Necator americanus]|uniref:Uncharacterized protein n=1 Tax=Necator americanus TaxID=51031 RepID=W2T2L9_NECAM|nr:hypothetical protein NECAME_12126 [Necator americanus]ETN75784.1 hypothetical protein NECAME_12126 [Necator americanus]
MFLSSAEKIVGDEEWRFKKNEKNPAKICGKNIGEKVYNHLFFFHSYSKDEIKHIQQENRQLKENSTNLIQCPQCEVKLKLTECGSAAKKQRLELPLMKTVIQTKWRRQPLQPVQALPQYSAEQLEFCVKCFRTTPTTDELEDDWQKCSNDNHQPDPQTATMDKTTEREHSHAKYGCPRRFQHITGWGYSQT